MRISRVLEPFSEEISRMSKTDEDHVAVVGREQDVIGRILLFVVGNRLAKGMLRGEAQFFVREMAKL